MKFNQIPLKFIFDPREKAPSIGSVGQKMQLVYPPVHSMLVTRSCCNLTNDDRYNDAEWLAIVLARAHVDHVSDAEEGDIISIYSDSASRSDAGSAQAEEDRSELRQSSDQAGGHNNNHETAEPIALRDLSFEADVVDCIIKYRGCRLHYAHPVPDGSDHEALARSHSAH